SCVSPEIGAYIALDFTAYLKRIHAVFIPEKNEPLLEKQKQLGKHIKEMQQCRDADTQHYLHLNHQLEDMIAALCTHATNLLNDDAPNYITAIRRIETLFKKQLILSLGLSEAQQNLLIEQEIEELTEVMQQLLRQASSTKAYFEIHDRSPEYTRQLSDIIRQCHDIDYASSDDEDRDYHDIRPPTETFARYTALTQTIQSVLSANPDDQVKTELLTAQRGLSENSNTINVLEQTISRQTLILNNVQSELTRAQESLLTANAALDEIRARQHGMDLRHATLATQLNQATLPLDGLSLQLLGTAALILGAAAVALGLTALVMGTAGMGALVMGASGAVSCFSGAFFFYHGTRINQPIVPGAAAIEPVNV
ncbi:MAG TPA: hypothetical protein DDY37_07035, partial [Legionella sp.]|nr:hypothetical protein [Legionella sp.]